MEKPIFTQREIEAPEELEELPTKELVEEIEYKQENAEFLSGIEMANAYVNEGIMKSLGKMTEKEMKDLTMGNEKIKAEFIPKQLRGNNNEEEYAVYEFLKEGNLDSPAGQKIMQDEIKRQRDIQKRTAEQYESLVEIEKMDSLGTLTREEIAEYEAENNIPKENIKEVPCFDDNGNFIENSRCYYKITS